MPKEYPLKPELGSKFVDVCECGHQWCYHKVAFIGNGECEKCGCPKYKFEKQMMMKDAIKLESQIESSARKVGYTQ